MPAQFTRADSIREYLTGALVDGGLQVDPKQSLGGYRSSQEALSLGIMLTGSISGVTVLYASGANPIGQGALTAVDANHLTWQPSGLATGPPTSFSGTLDTEVVEGPNPGQYLRITGSTPFTVGQCKVTLSYLTDNVFSMDDVSVASALSGQNEYRATILRNESANIVTQYQRWVAMLGTPQVSNLGFLSVIGGAGSISTSGSFVDWPTTGWCQVRSSGGTIKEVVYYTSRTNSTLTVPGSGRALLGTVFAAGSITDSISPVPGVAIALDPTGNQPFGSSIQQVSGPTVQPAGVTWNLEITPAGGLNLGTWNQGTQLGIWEWRQIPALAVSTPQAIVRFNDSFSTY